MPTQIDIYRAANQLIKRYGNEARIFAALRADACVKEDDTAGAATWLRVIDAVEELQTTTR